MNRRAFIALLGGAVVTRPLAARAQQPGRTYRLGFFLPVARDAPAMIAFFDELRVHGFVEGQNLENIPGGFQAGNQQIDDLVPALIKIDLFLRQQGLDTTTPAGKAMFQMMGVFAEFERANDSGRSRCRAGAGQERGASRGWSSKGA